MSQPCTSSCLKDTLSDGHTSGRVTSRSRTAHSGLPRLLIATLALTAAALAWLAPQPDVRAQLACLQSAPPAVCSEAGR